MTYKNHGLSTSTEYIYFDIHVHFSTNLRVLNNKIYIFEKEKHNMQ